MFRFYKLKHILFLVPVFLLIGIFFQNCSKSFTSSKNQVSNELELSSNKQCKESVWASRVLPSFDGSRYTQEVYVGQSGAFYTASINYNEEQNFSQIILSKSLNQGMTWEFYTIENNVQYMSWGHDIFEDGGIIYYSAQVSYPESTDKFWMIYRSNDGGSTWEMSDKVLGGVNSQWLGPYKIKKVKNKLYAVGTIIENGIRVWKIRASESGSVNSWSDVDSYISEGASSQIPLEISSDSKGNIFVLGQMRDSGDRDKLILRASLDNGVTWNNIFIKEIVTNSQFITYVDSNDSLFVGYVELEGDNINNWIISKSTDLGATWSDVSKLSFDGSVAIERTSPYYGPSALSSDSEGNFIATGYPNGTILKGTNAGTTWTQIKTPIDDLGVYSMAIDSVGNVVVISSDYVQETSLYSTFTLSCLQ